MKDRKQQSNKKITAHRFLHFYRNRVMNILVIAILALYFVIRMSYTIPQEIQRCYDLLSQNVQQAQQYQQYSNEANELYLTIQDQEYISACNVFIDYIAEGYDEQLSIDRINSISDDYDSVFYLKSDGTLLSCSDRAPLDLTEEDTAKLLDEGTLQKDGETLRYFALQNEDAHMIVRIDEADSEQISMDVMQMLSLDGFIYNSDTLEILEADDDAFPGNIGDMYFGDPQKIKQFADSEMQIRLISPSDSGIFVLTKMKLAAVMPLGNQNNGISICAYIPVSEIVCNILVKSGLPTFLCLGFICLTIFGSLHFRRVVLKVKGKEDDEKPEKKTIHLPFRCCINPELTRGILFMQFFMGLLVIFCSVILLTISRFSISYEDIKYNLEQLVSTEETCQDALDGCWDAYSSPAVGMAGSVDTYLQAGDVTSDEAVQKNLQNLVKNTFLDEAAVYDRNGECVYTTADSIGYPLTTDSDSALYSFWELMSGDLEYVIARSETRDGIIYCAKKRSDEVGIVVLTFSDQGFSELEQKLSPDSVTASFLCSDSCLFVDKTDDMTDETAVTYVGYRVLSDGTEVSCETPGFPVLADKQKFCGFRTVDDRQNFIVGLGDENRSIFYLRPVSEIIDGLGESIATYVIFLILVCLLDFLGCAVYTEESLTAEGTADEEKPEKNVSHQLIARVKKRVTLSDEMEDSQRIIWRHSLYSTIALIVITLLLDVLLNENSMIAFLLNGRWEKGVNLFALSVITLIILAACLLFRLLRLFFDELSRNFPRRFSTAIQMTHSILTIVIAVILVVCCANEVGIDTKTILASVGIGGLALGIAAKDTINDMLNGLFIIIDGRIQVGDFVEVSGFYGEVVKIGIRTTKVHRYNQEVSINNSDMKNLLNDSKGESSVYIKFRVGQETDLALLKKVITESTDRFQEACSNRLKSGFFYLGVEAFDAESVTCSIFAFVDEKYKKSLIRKCNQVLLELLKENGIRISTDLVIEAEDGRKVRVLNKEQDE